MLSGFTSRWTIVFVCMPQGDRDLPRNSDGFEQWELFLRAEAITQRAAFHQWQHVIQMALALAGIEQRDDGRMAQLAEEADFLQEVMVGRRFVELGSQQLDGDETVGLLIARAVHDGRGATADLAIDQVAIVEQAARHEFRVIHALENPWRPQQSAFGGRCGASPAGHART